MVKSIIYGMWLLIRLEKARNQNAGNGGKKKQRTQ
jgi:phage protein U